MRAVLQRVRKGAVVVDGQVIGSVDLGFVALVGVTHSDTQSEAELLARKTAQLRVFEDAEGKMNLSALDVGAGVLVISQFTLYGDCRKGNRPSFIEAASADQAEQLYQRLAARMRAANLKVATGRFKAHMEVSLINDGPVTLILDSERNS